MDHLKEGIGLRGYAQRDPLVEYKRESFEMFEGMLQRFQEDTIRYLFHMQIVETSAPMPAIPSGENDGEAARQPALPQRRAQTSVDDLEEQFQRRKKRELEQARMAGATNGNTPQTVVRDAAKVGRNDPCPCGSGKKYKKCHGTAAKA
jgi:preprotein translocase subunit SecA